jgi:hypothetical protein
MNDFDRQLIDLSSTLTDEGQVVPLRLIGLGDEPNLVFACAADRPVAVAEVRSRHGRTV